MDGNEVMPSLSAAKARELIASGVIAGGMIPKVEACLFAAENGCRAAIVDGRAEHAVLSIVDGQRLGTDIGAE
jgi:acetylglutamate kinase